MDLLYQVTLADEPPEFKFKNALRQDARPPDPTEQETYAESQFREWNSARETAHRRSFPLNDNLLSLLLHVHSDL